MRVEYIFIVLIVLMLLLVLATDIYVKSVKDLYYIIRSENDSIVNLLEEVMNAYNSVKEQYEDISEKYELLLEGMKEGKDNEK